MNEPRRPVGLPVVLAAFLAIPTLRAADEELPRQEIAKLAKPATVLIEATSGVGSGFCIHPAGLFLTNEHVVSDVAVGATVTLVLDAGLKTQKKLTAKVIRRDKDLDLALLRAQGEHKLPTLSLGSDEGLAELTEVIAFGFPFGTALAKPGEYPAISINVGNISSLRRDAKLDLHRIQLDAVLNPGNSGGPVLDRKGKVVGVVVSGIRRAGINLAIPVSHASRFLAPSEITFTAPAIQLKSKHEPIEFKATAVSLTVPATPLEVELVLTNDGGAERRCEMKAAGTSYSVTTVPFPIAKDPANLRVEVKYKDALVSGAAQDRTFRVGKQSVKLSEVRRLRFGTSTEVFLNSGKNMEGPLSEFTSVSVKVGGEPLNLKLDRALEVTVVPILESNTVACTIVASHQGKEVGRHNQSVSLQSAETVIHTANRAEAVLKDLKAFEGKWKLDRIETNGSTSSDPERYGVLFDENEVTLTLDGKKYGSARITIDPTQTPKTMDILWNSGPSGGGNSLAIYRLMEGGSLEICWNQPRGRGSDKRPKLFTTKVELGAGSVWYIFRRP